MNGERHWDRVYATKSPDQVSWYRPHLDRSLDFVERAGLDASAPIIDIGGGTSTLAGDLLDRGYRDVTVLDISQAAIVRRSLRVDGHLVVATFGPCGPEKCSGLDVARYDPDALHGQFGGSFRKVASCTEQHRTPWGAEQEFVYCYCRLS